MISFAVLSNTVAFRAKFYSSEVSSKHYYSGLRQRQLPLRGSHGGNGTSGFVAEVSNEKY